MREGSTRRQRLRTYKVSSHSGYTPRECRRRMAARLRSHLCSGRVVIRARSVVLGNRSLLCGPLIYIYHLHSVSLTYVPTHSFHSQALRVVRESSRAGRAFAAFLSGTIHDTVQYIDMLHHFLYTSKCYWHTMQAFLGHVERISDRYWGFILKQLIRGCLS